MPVWDIGLRCDGHVENGFEVWMLGFSMVEYHTSLEVIDIGSQLREKCLDRWDGLLRRDCVYRR